ncbi:PEP-CTERM sorting domain-containing protein [uncultured Sphaerotilus sp.]|uniref:PEP-CTERM sorting domain-containing protein n=1 Tax=uncultured Sphaerotilus sp. TaxID=474984 RepID=UPI0030CA4CDF
MLKKLVYALALTGLASGQAFALTNPGFEAGLGANPAGWITPLGTLTSVASGSTVHVIDDAYFPTPTEIYSANVTAMSGNNFGLLETCPASTAVLDCGSNAAFSINLGGPVSNYGDVLWMRLFTADFLPADYNDSVTVSYYGVSSGSALQVDTISVQTMYDEVSIDPDTGAILHGNTDSGWKGFGVPIGTNSLVVQLNNAATVDIIKSDTLYNRPIVALDYAAAAVSPVPEADASAMMLAGLGVLGMVARRRAKRAAA